MTMRLSSEDAAEMKDQLCTLLITFTDGGDPTKQITTTHTFVSTDLRHYPQQRTVGWSDGREKDVEENADPKARPRVTTLFRSAQTPLGEVGEDMIEQERRTNYHLKPTVQHYSTSPTPQKRTKQSDSDRPRGLPRTETNRLVKVEESSRTIDQYNKRNARPTQPSLNTATKSVPVRVAERARLLNEQAKEEASTATQKHKLSKSTETLQTSGVGKRAEMLPPHRHQARSYESIHESFERNNQHTEISYKREVNEFKTKLPTEGRRLPRHSDDFHVYQRYDGSPRSVDKPEPKRRRGQYIREEFHTEEHYIVTRTPLAGKQTEETRFPGRDQEHTEKGTQELKIEIEDKKPPPRKEEDVKQMRLIDYNEYESEVRRLQEQALHVTKPGRTQADTPPLVPLTPAIVLPASQKDPIEGRKPRVDSDLRTTYYSRTTEKRDHTSRSPIPPPVSPTPANTPMQADRSFPSDTDEQRRIRELAAESFQEKIEILKTSKRFRPSGSPHSDYIIGGSPSPRHFSPATTRRADSSQHSDTFSSPAPHTVTSFPATPLPDYTRETPPLSSSTPPPQPLKSGVRGVLTKETTHEFITDIVEERRVQKAPRDEPKLQKVDKSRTTVFPIHDDTALIVEPKHLATGEIQTVTEDIAERLKQEEDERRYQESLRQKLSYEEQVELEIQKRRLRGDNDEMRPELLPVVDEEEELGLHDNHHLPADQTQHLTETVTRTEENTVVTTKRIYIDTIRDAYLGPLHLLGRQTDLDHVEFEPKRPAKPIETRNVATQEDLSVPPEAEKDERSFDEKIETEIRRRMAHVGDRSRDPSYYEPKKFEAEKPDRSSTTEHSTTKTTTTTTHKTVQKTSTDDGLKPLDYYYKAQPAPLPRMESRAEYRSNISSRANNFARPQRTMSPIGSQGFSTTGNRVLKILTESSSVGGSGFSPYGGSSAATTIRDTREREKKEMSDLNDRLASYIEKVRFLEAQNRKIATDLAYLQTRWGQDTSSVRDMYEGDLKQAKRVLDEMEKLRHDLLDECRSLQDDINGYRRNYDEALRLRELSKDQLDELLVKLSALESELGLLKRRISNLETDVGAVKRENQHFITSLQRARADLDQETLNRIDYQNQAQTLIEEIEFLRRAHDSEIHDLQAMASRDTTSENREYFKNELAAAIRDIRAEYDQLTTVHRTDMESWYKLKVQEIQTQSARHSMEQTYAADEIKRLRSQLSDLRGKLADLEGRNAILEKNMEELNFQLEDDQRNYESALHDRDTQIRKIRDECQMLMVELQMLLDTKQTLDAEIAIYRKMLEGEEDRAGLRQLVEQVVRTHHHRHADESESMRVIRGETSSRHSYQRSAKGNVSIHEASPDGRYIILENTHRAREEHIGNWKLKRRIDNRRDIVYTFPSDFVLAPGKSVKIWARNQGVLSPPDQLIFNDEDSFGVGNNVQTILYNTQGEERATLIQRSSQV